MLSSTHVAVHGFFSARVCVCVRVTQNCGDDDNAIDEKPSEESQHCKHHVGGWKSAGDGEEHPKHVRHQ